MRATTSRAPLRRRRWWGLASALVAASATLASAEPWTHLLSSPGEPAGLRCVTAMGDGGALAGGALLDDGWLVRTDAFGALTWQRRLAVALGGSFVIVDVAPTAGGSVALGHRRHLQGAGMASESVITIVDQAGRTLGATGRPGMPQGVAVAADGTLLVLVIHEGTALVSRLDAGARPLWTRSLATAGPVVGGDVLARADGTFLVVLEPNGFGTETARPWIGWLDVSGSPFAQWKLDVPGSHDLHLAADWGRDALLAGASGGDCWLARFAADGTPTWGHVVELGFDAELLDLASASDDSAALLVTGSPDGKGVVVRLDAAGAAQWARSVGSLNGTSRVPAGGIALAGSSVAVAASFPGSRSRPQFGVMAGLDASGNVVGCITTGARAFGVREAPLDVEPVGFVAADVPPEELFRTVWTQLPVALDDCSLECISDEQEPDDDCSSTSTAWTVPVLVAGNFCGDADDWMRVGACGGDSLVVETDLLSASANTRIEVYDADCGTLLAEDDDSGIGLGSRVVLAPRASGQILVHVSQVDGTTGSDRSYRLRVEPAASVGSLGRLLVGPVGLKAQVGAPRIGGGFVVGGIGGRQAWVAAIDVAGAADWAILLTVPDEFDPRLAIGAAADGGALVVTTSSTHPAPTTLVRIDAAGRIAWQSALAPGVTESTCATSVAERPGGGFLVGGSVVRNWSFADAWLLAVDDAGAVSWERAYRGGGLAFVSSVAPLADGGSAVAVTARNQRSLLRVDASGRLTWSSTSIDDGAVYDPALVAARADGGFDFVASAAGAGLDRLVVARLDSTGRLASARAFDVGLHASPVALTSVGGALLLQATLGGGLGIPALASAVVRIEPTGEPSWAIESRGAGEGGAACALALQSLPGGDVASVSAQFDDPTSAASPPVALLRTDAAGGLASGCQGVSALRVEEREPGLHFLPGLVVVPPRSSSPEASQVGAFPVTSLVAAGCACTCGELPVPGEVSPPGSSRPLRIDGDTLTWERGAASGSCRFNVYRGDLAQLRMGDHGQCLASGVERNVLVDATPPPPGSGWFYLVTGVAQHEGIAGLDHFGRPEPIAVPCR